MNVLKQGIYNYIIPSIGRLFVNKNHYVNVIYYHDIVRGEGETYMRTNIKLFKQQMLYIRKCGYETLRFDDFCDSEKLLFKKNRILIGFDDGWVSNYSEIFEFMQSLGIKYNVFLTIGKIDKNPDYLTWEQVKIMHKSGLVGFGAHTYTHPDMSRLKDVDLSLEIDKANSVFYSHLGFAPLDFCYPFGYYSNESNKAIEAKGCYNRIYTSNMMYSYKDNNTIIMGRNGISNAEPMRVFIGKLQGYYNIWKCIIK